MEHKQIWQTIQVNTICEWSLYEAFIYNLNTTREKIKELYPEVDDKDIAIFISYGKYNDLKLSFGFRRFETVEEQNKHLNNEAKQREFEKEKMMNEIKSFFKLYPELKETLLNN